MIISMSRGDADAKTPETRYLMRSPKFQSGDDNSLSEVKERIDVRLSLCQGATIIIKITLPKHSINRSQLNHVSNASAAVLDKVAIGEGSSWQRQPLRVDSLHAMKGRCLAGRTQKRHPHKLSGSPRLSRNAACANSMVRRGVTCR